MKKIIMSIIVILIIVVGAIFIFSKDDESAKKEVKTKKNDLASISYYKKEYKERYDNYKKKNKELSNEDVITRVNIGLDNSYYTNTYKTPYPNKDYILVNKYIYLGEDYVPDNLEDISTNYSRSGMRLVSSAKDAFETLAEQALKDNKKVIAMSSYRSYQYQVNLYNRYVANEGVNAADTYSARPGYSEHQTGLCVDVYDGVIDYTNFEKSDSYNWMMDNAYKYGFILRYPKGKENITGYQYESWHYRYVGKKIAKYIHDNDITFDEYYVRQIADKMK